MISILFGSLLCSDINSSVSFEISRLSLFTPTPHHYIYFHMFIVNQWFFIYKLKVKIGRSHLSLLRYSRYYHLNESMEMVSGRLILPFNKVYPVLVIKALCVLSGGYMYLLDLLFASGVPEVQAKCADLLGRLCADKLSGPRVRLALDRFLPPALCDALRDSPAQCPALIDSTHENPELLWNEECRKKVGAAINHLATR